MRRILLTGCGGAAAVGVARSLKRSCYLFGVDTDRFKILRTGCYRNRVIPSLKGKSYIDYLNKIIGKDDWYIDFVHAQPYNEVLTISKYRSKLDATTFLPSHRTVVDCTDKYRSYQLWSKGGVKVPYTRKINSMYDILEMITKYGTVWIRDTVGAGGVGSLKVNNDNFEFACSWIRLNRGFGKWVVSEYLSPNTITFMTLWRDGELWAAQSRERIYWEYSKKTLSGVTGITGAAKTVTRNDVIQVGLDSIRAVDSKPNGIFSVDMTYDGDGFPCPTEINIGKFFTTVQFFSEAGLNFPEIYVDLALGENPEKRGINPLPDGLVWIRGMDMEPVLTSVDKVK